MFERICDFMPFLNICKCHKTPTKINVISPKSSFCDGHYNTIFDVLKCFKKYDTGVKKSLPLCINVNSSSLNSRFHLFGFKLKSNNETYFRDGHYTILVLISSMTLVSVLQMLSCGFTTLASFVLDLHAYTERMLWPSIFKLHSVLR